MFDPGGADVREQPGELAGAVGQDHRHDGVRRGAAAVLARQPGPAGVAPDQHLAQRGPGPLGVLGHLVQRAHDRVDVLAQLGQDAGHRLGVGREDVHPQVGVGGGHPGDVAQALTGQRQRRVLPLGQPGGDQRGRHLRHVRDQGDGGVVGGGGHRRPATAPQS